MCDQTEVANIDWREYMYWTAWVFGENSEEFRTVLPDSSVWRNDSVPTFSEYEYANDYLRHPMYNNYPVVGISQDQARDYSKWRADRVFEAVLVWMKKIEYDTFQKRNTYFTIEKYFNGTYPQIGERVKYYPVFRLPTLEERKQILQFSDSVDMAYYKKCKSKECKFCLSKFSAIYSEICQVDSSLCKGITFPIRSGCSSDWFYHLRGNVGEWLDEDSISVGGGWVDTKERILQSDTFLVSKQNAWTGFRCVAGWKEWGK